MLTLVTVIHIITCVLLVLVVLLQAGKGAEISASFSGSSQTIFGASGGANFFTRFTAILFAVFIVTSMTLTLLANRKQESVFEGMAPTATAPVQATSQAPAAGTAAGNQTAPTTNTAAEPAKTDAASATTGATTNQQAVPAANAPTTPTGAEQKK